MGNYVITIARGFGSGGKDVAMQVAERLGIRCYEHRILTMAAQMSGYEEARFAEVDEKLQNGYFINLMRSFPIAKNIMPMDRDFVSDTRLFEFQVKIIKELVKKESCVIVGKCADHILEDHPGKVSVYIEASRAACIRRLQERMKISEKEANRLIVKTDHYRTEYYKFYTGGKDWRAPINYDMMLNSEKMGIDGCTDMICCYLARKGYVPDEH